MQWVLRVVGFSAVCVTLAVTLVGVAAASIPADFCTEKSPEAVARYYYRGNVAVPLRCGTESWGFNHVVFRGRWNDAFDAQIAQTISRGTESRDRTVYASFDENCNELFRIIVNPGAIYGQGFSPQGIITAYYITPVTIGISHRSAPAPVTAPCLVTEPVSATGRIAIHGLDT